MKKLVFLALLVASCVSLSACTGGRGFKDGHPYCIQHEVLGISLSNMINPCK